MSTVQAAANDTHPVDSSVAVADTELTRSMCKLIGVVYRDVNCSSSKESDCIRSDPIQADWHDPECSSVPACTVVNAPLNASPALSLHVGPSVSDRSLPSAPTISCELEYPPLSIL